MASTNRAHHCHPAHRRPQVESNDGLVLASFAKHTSALRWAVQCAQHMQTIKWWGQSLRPEHTRTWQPCSQL